MQINKIHEQFIHALREGADLRLKLIDPCEESVLHAADAICQCFENGCKVLLFGNGGSAADAQHIAAEFVGRFACDRIPLPAIALTTDTSALTAIGNDYGFQHIFARQVHALGRIGDLAIAISTSGRSPNVLAGAKAANERGLTTVGFTGGGTGRLGSSVNIPIVVPATNTSRIQECHITIGHILCELVESVLFAEPAKQPKIKKFAGARPSTQ